MSQKRIYINGRFLMHAVTGVQRYAMELIRSIDAGIEAGEPIFTEFEFMVLTPSGKHPQVEFKHVKIRQVGKLTGHLWEQLELPLYTSDGYLLNLCNTAPMFKRNQTVTIHDAAVYAVPGTHSFAFKAWYKVLSRVLGVTARQILTCSAFSKNQLMQYYKIKKSKIKVIYHGKEHILNTAPDPDFMARNQLDKPFVLAVSSMSPSKNFRSIVQAIELIGSPDFDIVIAGGTSSIFKSSSESVNDNVKYLGYVKEEELRTLYNQAACFVFPSFYEGFGFPPLEAMACGCPVISSNAASLPEVCGDAVLYCDPHSPQDIADQIQRLMQDTGLREQLSREGIEQAKGFTWEQCARETVSAIRQAVNLGAHAEIADVGQSRAAVRK